MTERSAWSSLRAGSLGTRILVFFSALLASILGVSLAVVDTINARGAHAQIKQELAVGEKVFRRLVDQRNRQLAQAAEILTRDYAFRNAVAMRNLDAGTVASLLGNHGSRIGASVAELVSPERRLIADNRGVARVGEPFPFGWLLDQAEVDGRAAGIVVQDGRAYQMVAVPVLAPTPVAWAVFGIVVDDATARELQSLSGLDVSLMAHAPGGAWTMVASTLDPALRAQVGSALAAPHALDPQNADMMLGDAQYETLVVSLEDNGATPVVAVLQRSLDEALAPFRRLHAILIVLLLVGLGLAVAGSVVIVRGVTRPVRALGAMTQRIEEGDYSVPVAVEGADELRELARRFDLMREGIAARQAEILRLAYRDSLTGLPNRTRFRQWLDEALAAARSGGGSVSLLTMNLQRFRHVNETLGHAVGDDVLRRVSRRLAEVVRVEDAAARLGGDEFGVRLDGADPETAARVAERIVQAFEAPIALGPQPLDMRLAVGVATFPQHAEDTEGLLRCADAAMHAAKEAKLDVMVYDASLRERREQSLSLLSELKRAMETGELRLAYQPKVAVRGGAPVGAEALIRWVHPERGRIAPDQFIPFAEQTGFIRTVTPWVIRAAVAQCARWRDGGLQVPVSVNISAQDLLAPGLVEVVTGALSRHELPAALLCLEITETGVMADPPRAVELLAGLHAVGVRLSMDDFGTGYSSLAYIKQLRLNELKIDRSFVGNIVDDSKDRAIVLSAVELAHNLGLSVVAEGVESQAVLEVLRSLGCDAAQGYLFSPALEAEPFADWLRAQQVPAAASA
ncbi:MAG: EAL domain-containing protein [Nevskia sp.]|nr:EAL domain-containing protein [Nevskia sp.]